MRKFSIFQAAERRNYALVEARRSFSRCRHIEKKVVVFCRCCENSIFPWLFDDFFGRGDPKVVQGGLQRVTWVLGTSSGGSGGVLGGSGDVFGGAGKLQEGSWGGPGRVPGGPWRRLAETSEGNRTEPNRKVANPARFKRPRSRPNADTKTGTVAGLAAGN